MKKFATARRHDLPRDSVRQIWPRQTNREATRSLPRDNQVVQGLIVGLPLALAMWLALAIVAWIVFQ